MNELLRKNQPFPVAKKQKTIGMLFSGGLDSTFLLYKNLCEGHKVHCFYIEITNNQNKSKIEKQQAFRIFERLKRDYPEQLDRFQPTIKTEIWKEFDCGLKFNQMPIWLLGVMFLDHTRYDEIQIGYVANDDAIPYLDQLKKTFNQYSWLFERKLSKLTFPITQWHKSYMLDRLPYYLKELIFSCENPTLSDTHTPIAEEDWNKIDNHSRARNEFLSTDKVYYNFEPCGDCDPCKKILNTDQIYHNYVDHQPVFQKLKIKQVITDYNRFKDNSHTSKIFDQVIKERQNLWEMLPHPAEEKDYQKAIETNEVKGNDVVMDAWDTLRKATTKADPVEINLDSDGQDQGTDN